MKKINLYISDMHYEVFRKISDKTSLKRSDLLRRMIEEYAEKLKIEK